MEIVSGFWETFEDLRREREGLFSFSRPESAFDVSDPFETMGVVVFWGGNGFKSNFSSERGGEVD